MRPSYESKSKPFFFVVIVVVLVFSGCVLVFGSLVLFYFFEFHFCNV